MNDVSSETLLAEIVAALEDHAMIGEPSYDGLSMPQKAIVANKLDAIEEEVGDLVSWLRDELPDGIDALGLVELQLEIHVARESQLSAGEVAQGSPDNQSPPIPCLAITHGGCECLH